MAEVKSTQTQSPFDDNLTINRYFTLTNDNDPYWAKPCLTLARNTITVKVYFDKLNLIQDSGSHSILIPSLHGSTL